MFLGLICKVDLTLRPIWLYGALEQNVDNVKNKKTRQYEKYTRENVKLNSVLDFHTHILEKFYSYTLAI